MAHPLCVITARTLGTVARMIKAEGGKNMSWNNAENNHKISLGWKELEDWNWKLKPGGKQQIWNINL